MAGCVEFNSGDLFIPTMWGRDFYHLGDVPANMYMASSFGNFDGDADYGAFIHSYAREPYNYTQCRYVRNRACMDEPKLIYAHDSAIYWVYGSAIYQAHDSAIDRPKAPEMGRNYYTPRARLQKIQNPKTHCKRRGKHF